MWLSPFRSESITLLTNAFSKKVKATRTPPATLASTATLNYPYIGYLIKPLSVAEHCIGAACHSLE